MKNPTPYPLCWPTGYPRTKVRYSDQFRVGMAVARADLMKSVAAFGGKDCIISSNLTAFSDSTNGDPGIALWFKWKGAWRCIACDTYSRVIANIRAVGLTVDALRAMERYGTQMLDQLMEGVSTEKALPPHDRQWWEVLGLSTEPTHLEPCEAAYRKLAAKTHPDTGGSKEEFQRVQEAIEAARERFRG